MCVWVGVSGEVSVCVCVCVQTIRGSIGKNGTSNFTNASEWAWHVESRAWYAEVTGYTATTVHVHIGPLLAGGVQQRPDRGRGRTITSL